MKIEIKARFSASVLFECEAETMKAAVELAVEKKIDLRGADLGGAYLRGAYLGGANLRGAYLRGAYLRGADLGGADLGDADLGDAYLGGANLRGADLGDADLGGANLGELKKDYFERLSLAKHEVPELYKAILSGRIDGSQYEGECACFCGTIANARKEDYRKMGIDLRPDSTSPTEVWYTNIRKGDTPANNQVSKLTADWTREFLEQNKIKVPEMEVIWK